MTRREQWKPVLDVEVKRWSAKSCEQLISELADDQAYEVEFESKKFPVEVQLLMNTAEYVQVMIAVDDGQASRPLTNVFA